MVDRKGPDLFMRRWRVQVDDFVVDTLPISFEIQKDMRREANKATIRVFNLSESRRKDLQVRHLYGIQLEAGYDDLMEVIFLGDIDRISSHKEGTDWITEFSAGDGVKASRKKVKISKTNAKTNEILAEVTAAAGRGEGNLKAALTNLDLQGKLPPGSVSRWYVQGNVGESLERITRDLGMTFSMQDGQPSFAKLGALVDAQAGMVKLNASTGLIGSPEVSKKGFVKARCLIQQKLVPGRGVIMDAEFVKGVFQVQKVTYRGSTFSSEWYADVELLQVNG